MKKIIISVVFAGAFASYAFYNYFSSKSADASSAPVTATVSNTSGSDTTGRPINSTPGSSAPPVHSTPAPTPTPTHTPSATLGEYTDGSYTGSVVDAFYGNVQVQAIISGGKLTKVNVLQYPNQQGNSISINTRAMPILSSEAIQAQSANVNGVSGASQSSAAFVQSLSSALAEAKA